MTLEQYFQRKGAKSLTELAASVGVAKSYISKVKRTGQCSAPVAIRIEKETSGLVNASSLSQAVRDARKTA